METETDETKKLRLPIPEPEQQAGKMMEHVTNAFNVWPWPRKPLDKPQHSGKAKTGRDMRGTRWMRGRGSKALRKTYNPFD